MDAYVVGVIRAFRGVHIGLSGVLLFWGGDCPAEGGMLSHPKDVLFSLCGYIWELDRSCTGSKSPLSPWEHMKEECSNRRLEWEEFFRSSWGPSRDFFFILFSHPIVKGFRTLKVGLVVNGWMIPSGHDCVTLLRDANDYKSKPLIKTIN